MTTHEPQSNVSGCSSHPEVGDVNSPTLKGGAVSGRVVVRMLGDVVVFTGPRSEEKAGA